MLVSSDFGGRDQHIDLGSSTVQQLRTWTGDVDDFGTRVDRGPGADHRRPGRRSSASRWSPRSTPRGVNGPAAWCPTSSPSLGFALGLGVAGLVPALAADPPSYARPGACRHRGPGRPARGAAALDPRGRRRRGRRRHRHRAERQRARAPRPRRRRRGPPGRRPRPRPGACATCSPTTRRSATTSSCSASRVLVRQPQPGASRAGAASASVTTLRDRTELLALQSELSARESITEHAAGADPRVQQPAAHHLRPRPARGVRRGVAARRHADPAPPGDLRRGRWPTSTTRPWRRCSSPRRASPPSGASTSRLADDSSLPRLDPEASADVGTVLGNLVDNAVDASVSVGGTSIEVVARASTATWSTWQVADTGPGVPADERRPDLPPRLELPRRRRVERPGCRAGARAGRLRASGRLRRGRCGEDGTGAVFDGAAAPEWRSDERDGRPRPCSSSTTTSWSRASTRSSWSAPRASSVVGVASSGRGRPRRHRAGCDPTWCCSTSTCPT